MKMAIIPVLLHFLSKTGLKFNTVSEGITYTQSI